MANLLDPLMRPMLAAKMAQNYDLHKLKYPVLATPKLDGIRCLTIDPVIAVTKDKCQAVTRTLKPIPNDFIRIQLETLMPGLDGELVKLDNAGKIEPFNVTSSAIMSQAGWPTFQYIVFDYGHNFVIRPPYPQSPYHRRAAMLYNDIPLPDFCVKLMPRSLNNADELLAYEAACLLQGYEGVCFRTPDSPYKLGRSTLKEQYLVKMKRFLDSEARIIGMEELMHNDNPASLDERGYTQRSSHKANQSHSGMMGKLNLEALEDCGPIKKGTPFNLGTGFTEAQRENMWQNKSLFIGQIAKYRFQPHGVLDKPRVCSFLGIRHEIDLDVKELDL